MNKQIEIFLSILKVSSSLKKKASRYTNSTNLQAMGNHTKCLQRDRLTSRHVEKCEYLNYVKEIWKNENKILFYVISE